MPLRGFGGFVWATLAVNVLVIIWGAFVRASKSGDGCGNHWPTCNGEVVPLAGPVAMLIEFVHRATSGLALLLVLGLTIWAFRAYAAGHLVRRGAVLSLIFIVIEALIGAGLVRLGLTGTNDSPLRAAVLGLHLVNTFLLLGSLTLTGWWTIDARPPRLRGQGALGWLLIAGLIGLNVVGATGAITALGDTLMPSRSLAEGLRQDLSPTAHFLIQLRVIHPVLAIVVSGILIAAGSVAQSRRPTPVVIRLTRLLLVVVAIQVAAGVINLLLLAPIPLQLIHLLLADLAWIMLVLTSVAALTAEASAVRRRLPQGALGDGRPGDAAHPST